MISVMIEKYKNDFLRKDFVKEFASLGRLEDWIFDQMKADYSDKKYGHIYLCFPKENSIHEIGLLPEQGGPRYWIHLIKNKDGIIFSDGRHTAGREHCSKEVREWFAHCRERQFEPKFNFVD